MNTKVALSVHSRGSYYDNCKSEIVSSQCFNNIKVDNGLKGLPRLSVDKLGKNSRDNRRTESTV